MAETTKASDASLAETRIKALEEARAEVLRLAKQWQSEADETHSSHQVDLRRTWADAAEKVADAIAALARPGRSS